MLDEAKIICRRHEKYSLTGAKEAIRQSRRYSNGALCHRGYRQ
jgi:hypothetical protein